MRIEADWDVPNEKFIRLPAGRYLGEVSAVEAGRSQSGAQQLKLTFLAVEHEMRFLCTDRLTFDSATKSMSMSVAKLKILGLNPSSDTDDAIGRRAWLHIKRVDRPEGNGKPAASWLEVNIYGSDHCGYELAPDAPDRAPVGAIDVDRTPF